MFDDLFLNEEEQRRYTLSKLEDKFIISEEEMLKILAYDVLEAKESYERKLKYYLHYKEKFGVKEK
jgi:hypothetical protein